jgi:protochlorophyllide reductase
LLLPKVQPNDGRFVVTASGVHDPASPGGAQGKPATLGDLTGLERDGRYFEMVDGGPFNADKAYKDSKVRLFEKVRFLIAYEQVNPYSVLVSFITIQLCNVMFTRELQRRLDSNPATSKITANCFNPGLIVGTGLFRDQNPFFTKVSVLLI